MLALPRPAMPHATFSTPLGTCAIAWNDTGLTRFLLPDPERPASGNTEAEPPSWVGEIVERVKRHLVGEAQGDGQRAARRGRDPGGAGLGGPWEVGERAVERRRITELGTPSGSARKTSESRCSRQSVPRRALKSPTG